MFWKSRVSSARSPIRLQVLSEFISHLLQPRPTVRVSATPTRCLSPKTPTTIAIFSLSTLLLISIPAFFGQWYNSSEEQVPLFAAAYDLHLFFPGSNRMLMVLPFATSWLGTPARIGTAHFVIIVMALSAGLTAFAWTLSRALFFPFCLAVLISILTLFGNQETYSFYLSPVQPYALAFSLGLLGYAILVAIPRKSLPSWPLIVILLVLTIAAAGYNPSASLLLSVFLGLSIIAVAPTSATRGVRAPGGRVLSVLIAHRNLASGAGLNLLAMAAALWLSGWYKTHFPQEVRSNYSVDNYILPTVSVQALRQGIIYLVEFHERAGIFGPSISRWFVAIVLLSGPVASGLWWLRRTASPDLAVSYRTAFLLWASAVFVFMAVSQNAHVQLTSNLIRGRYFSLPYYTAVLSLCLLAATAWADISSRWPQWSDAGKFWLLGVASLSCGSWLVQVVEWGSPRLEILMNNNTIVDNSATSRLAKELREAKVPAILGNYWWIWELQYELNKNAASKPVVTPVAIRTESFGLNAFGPILSSLRDGKSFRFACIELRNPPPGMDEGCATQIDFFRVQGGFPLGQTRELSHADVDRYKLTFFDLGLANSNDIDDCTASQMLFRAEPVSGLGREVSAFFLDEDSFVYFQSPRTESLWVLKFKNKSAQQIVKVPRGAREQLHILSHQFDITSTGCRVLITMSHQDNLFPAKVEVGIE
jgi:hypothetical protein